MPSYAHTQTGYLHWICLGTAAVMAAIAVLTADERVLLLTFVISGLVCGLLAACCYSLTVRDAGNRLTVRFGPLPLFRTSVRYAQMKEVRTVRSSWLDGLGVHYRPGHGWIFNVHGRDCVEVHSTNGRTLRIGTDQPEALAEFLRTQLPRSRQS